MKKIDIGQAVQVLANVGVIASIAFLALQIRQNSEQLAGQSRFNYYQGRLQFSRELAEGPITPIIDKYVSGEPLSAVEHGRMEFWFSGIFVQWEYEFGEYQRGLISRAEFNVAAKRKFLNGGLSELLEPIWADYRETGPEEFVQFVEREIASE